MIKPNVDILMNRSNITICNDRSRGVFDFHVKIFDNDQKFLVRSVSIILIVFHCRKYLFKSIIEKIRIDQNINRSTESKYWAIVLIPLFLIIGMGPFEALKRSRDFHGRFGLKTIAHKQ